MALEAIWFLIQYADPVCTTLVDARNGFNEMNCLEMLWTVNHCLLVGLRFVLNCYRHWAQLLLCQSGDAPVILLSLEGVTHVYFLLIVLYGITLVPWKRSLWKHIQLFCPLFYANDAAFDGSSRWRVVLMHLLMVGGTDRGYFPEL